MSTSSVEEVRDPYFLKLGGPTKEKYRHAETAIDHAPDDPLVVWRCLTMWSHYAMPVAEGYSPEGPTNAVGRALLAKAIAAGDKILTTSSPESADARLVAFFTRTCQALALVIDRPTHEQLERAGTLLADAYDVMQLPGVTAEEVSLCDQGLRNCAMARRRAWQLVLAGAPYGGEPAEKLALYTTGYEPCFGWPIRPLAVDPAFQTWASAQLAERTRTRTHPTAAKRTWLENTIFKQGDPTEDEARGRMLYLSIKGMNQEVFTDLVGQAIEDKLHIAVEVLLSMGFDTNAIHDEDSGARLLHHAVSQQQSFAVRALIAAGADPDLASKPKKKLAKRESARELAKRLGRPAILAALDAKTSVPTKAEQELAAKLRDASVSLPRDWWSFFASLFGAEELDLAAFVERSLAGRPETPDQLLADVQGTPVEKFLLAVLLNRAGFVQGKRHRGALVVKDDLVVTGDLEVDGPIIDTGGEGSILCAGTVRAHAVATEADFLVGGDLVVRDLVWGDYNDCSLVVGGRIVTRTLVMTDHTCEAIGSVEAARSLEDPSAEELATVFEKKMFDDGDLDRARVVKALRAGKPVLRG